MIDKNLRVNRKWLMKVGAAAAFYASMGLAYVAHLLNVEEVILGIGRW